MMMVHCGEVAKVRPTRSHAFLEDAGVLVASESIDPQRRGKAIWRTRLLQRHCVRGQVSGDGATMTRSAL